MEIEKDTPWMDNLLSYFKTLKEIDDEIEEIRVSLCQISQFSPLSLFEYLDIDSKSFLTLNDFKSFLRSQNSTYDERKLRKMIHNFDKDNDFSINLNEFLGLILPRKNLVLQKNILSMVNSYNSNKNFSTTQEMNENLNKLILKEMDLIKDLDEISAKIKNSKIFSTYEAFLAITGDDKYMTKLNLYNFLKKNGVYINDKEVTQLMFRLDADNDDRISYEEFKEMFYPIKEDFVYSPKDDNKIQNNNYMFSFNNKYEVNKKYNYYKDNDKGNDYNNNDYDNNDYNNSNDDYKNYEYNKDYNENYNQKDFDNKEYEDYNNNSNKEKKNKKTKKVILKPAKNNINSDSNSDIFHSQDQNNNYLKNKQQDWSYSKFPNINNNNSTDNYIINNRVSKCKDCAVSKKYNNIEPSLNGNNNDEYNYKSTITDKSITINKRNNIPRNEYKYSSNNFSNNYTNDDETKNNQINDNDEKYDNNDIITIRNNRFFYPKNDYNNDINHNHKSMNCKGCMLSAKNIYNNYRNNNYRNNFNNSNNNNNNFRNNINSDNNNQTDDIYKRKEELIKKYCNNKYDDDSYGNNRNNYFFSQEENITNTNRCFSSPRLKLDNNKNNYNKNDNYNYNEHNKNSSLININNTGNRYISTNNKNTFSSPFSSNNNNDNKLKNTFTERFKRIKENNNYKNNSQKEKFFQLLIKYIKQDNIPDKSNEELRNMMTADNNFYDLFGEIKKGNKPGIQRDDIDKFMKENGYNAKNYEIEKIMEKMDKNKDNIIDYEEFISEFQPKYI